jgi:hypothetical protein
MASPLINVILKESTFYLSLAPACDGVSIYTRGDSFTKFIFSVPDERIAANIQMPRIKLRITWPFML